MDSTNFSIPAKRQQRIVSYINEKSGAQIKELSDLCHVSEATIRRDLDELAQSGQVERTHGGAMAVSSTSFERYHSEKIKLMTAEKRRIAKRAAELVKDGDSVFLDSGTTAFFLAQHLTQHRNLTIITNNLDIAYAVQVHASSTMVVTGGIRRDNYSVLVGSTTESFIKSLYVDIAFMGSDAVNPRAGVFNSNFMEIGVKQEVAKCGKRLVLITDRSKFSRRALTKVCDLSAIDVVITDKGLEEDIRELLCEQISNVILV